MLYYNRPPPHIHMPDHKKKTEKLKSHDLEGTALSKLCAVLNLVQVDICNVNPAVCMGGIIQLIEKQIEEHC